MSSRLLRGVVPAVGLAAGLAAPARVWPQPHAHPIQRIPVVPDSVLVRPLPLRAGTGAAHDDVGTRVSEAQRYYDQGLAYLHGYVWIEAARSFNQALRLDPSLALPDVALSVVYTELNLASKAGEALARARAKGAALTAHERQHLAIREAQAAAEASPADVARKTAYRAALDAATRARPDDVELWLWRGVAESPDPADRGQGAVAAGIPYFERALALSPGHPAAQHYLTHAYENGNRLAEALAHAAGYAKAAPAIPHAQHMHGHVLRRSGRIDEAIAAFEAADRIERAYFAAEDLAPELDWHYEHNLDLLAASYRYVGQMQKAETLLKRAFDTPSNLAVQMFNKREWPEFLVARGRTADALAAAEVLAGHPVTLVRATGHIESARALLAARRFDDAAAEANAALRELRAASDGAALVGPAFEAMQGEFFLRTGQREKGRQMLRSAAATLRAAAGPDNWAQALFALEATARAARESGDWEFAGWAAGAMREHDPNYAGTHYALALVAEHNTQAQAARDAFARAEALWRRADPDLPELREIRGRRREP